jgi:hypothetical protein
MSDDREKKLQLMIENAKKMDNERRQRVESDRPSEEQSSSKGRDSFSREIRLSSIRNLTASEVISTDRKRRNLD